MGKKQIQNSLNIFTKRVKQKFQPEQVLLFGSFARGQANEYSDVDLLVIAKKFSKIDEEKRFDLLYDLTADLRPDFHVYGFTPEEYEKASPLTSLSLIKEEGIPLLTGA